MTDIVERLCDRVDDAVQEITTLRAEIERLRAALREIAKTTYGYEPCMTDEEAKKYFMSRFFAAQAKARAALKEDGDGK